MINPVWYMWPKELIEVAKRLPPKRYEGTDKTIGNMSQPDKSWEIEESRQVRRHKERQAKKKRQ